MFTALTVAASVRAASVPSKFWAPASSSSSFATPHPLACTLVSDVASRPPLFVSKIPRPSRIASASEPVVAAGIGSDIGGPVPPVSVASPPGAGVAASPSSAPPGPEHSPSWTTSLMSFLFTKPSPVASPHLPKSTSSDELPPGLPPPSGGGPGSNLVVRVSGVADDSTPMLMSASPPIGDGASGSSSPMAMSPPQLIAGSSTSTSARAHHAVDTDAELDSPRSLGSGLPAFHSYTPSSRLLSASASAGSLWTATKQGEDEGFAHTPPTGEHTDRSRSIGIERDLMRQSSITSSTGSIGSSCSSTSASTANSGLLPPLSGYGVLGTRLSVSGGVQHIYNTNMMMTPQSSLPSTPNTQISHVPTISDLQQQAQRNPMAVPRPLVFSLATSAPLPASTLTMASSSSAAASAEGSPTVTILRSGPLPQDLPEWFAPPDEVAALRAMFSAVPGLARSSFQLGDTLGTGTFGRVRLVSFLPRQPVIISGASQQMIATPGSLQYYALKMLKKSEIIRLKQVEHILAERAILSRIAHPFIVHLYASFQDERYLYMTMEYVIGGELFSQLRKAGRFSSETSKFYAAEILLALEYLHSLDIVYRDLKPENLLIDSEGHIKIADFGFAKVVEDRTWTLCGTPEYLAPEIIQSKGHGKAVDWWALGILIFEMLCGYPPFYDENPFGIYQKILAGKIDFPRHVSPEAQDLIRKLLQPDRTKRFGCLHRGAEDIRQHRWFAQVDWSKMLARKYRPPFVPTARAPNDTSNFDRYPDSREGQVQPQLSEKEKLLFVNF